MLANTRRYLCYLALCCPLAIQAEQTLFNKKVGKNAVTLSYGWQGLDNKDHKIELAFDAQQMHDTFRSFKRYKPAVALRNIEVGLRKSLPKLSKRGAQVYVLKRSGELEIQVKGRNKQKTSQILQQALQTKQEIENQFLLDSYYERTTDSYGHLGIKPAYTRFAIESMNLLTPLNQYIATEYGGYPTRYIINYILAFVQSIPYQDLENRRDSHGAGFNPPNRLLLENKGDCDSKSTLMASILRGVFPRVGIAIILLPDHALIGIQIPYQKSDDYVEVDGTHYVLAEPTGPALLPAARISEHSKRFIAGNAFTVEMMPFR
ncbi:hypothetical protein C2869_11345 [Saccharobesus litoralis]|uniref:Transglutaminase-like domain-containing protein n=1 Tax=Saccharobesus litoralis TaxID=2172099 RepID=A0A2S0VS12_9ALTE|nr:hypothetical protein [Saccharobesus litoralis]AWB66994.1 hypothetical protein C2869_11345 [Saccharobesus litoralis]